MSISFLEMWISYFYLVCFGMDVYLELCPIYSMGKIRHDFQGQYFYVELHFSSLFLKFLRATVAYVRFQIS